VPFGKWDYIPRKYILILVRASPDKIPSLMALVTPAPLTSTLCSTLLVKERRRKVYGLCDNVNVRLLNMLIVGQLAQTSYHALSTPYSFFGLGRTNNYIENLFVGSTKHSEDHFINMEGVVPNSKVVIIPPPDDSGTWKKELYLRPGEWIPLVTLTVVIGTALLAIIVLVLHLNEKVRFCRLFLMHVSNDPVLCSGKTSRKGEEPLTI
jgi:hypothetical protein